MPIAFAPTAPNADPVQHKRSKDRKRSKVLNFLKGVGLLLILPLLALIALNVISLVAFWELTEKGE